MSDLRDHEKLCEHGYRGVHWITDRVNEWCPGGEWVTDAVRLADADHDTFRERVSGWASRHGTHSFGDNVVDEILAATFGKVVPGE